jgi:hypothetical protein
MVQMFSWALGSTIPISSLFTKIEGKRGKVCNALVTFVNLTVVNGYGSSDEISFVDLLLIPTLLPRNLKRVIPPRTGLLRLAHSSPFSRFLENLSKKGISVTSPIPGPSWKQTKGNKLPRMDWKSDLVQLMHN